MERSSKQELPWRPGSSLEVWQEAKQHKETELLLLPSSWNKETGSDTKPLSRQLGLGFFQMRPQRHRNQ